MRRVTRRIQRGADVDPERRTIAQDVADFLDDYAYFRQRLSRRKSVKLAAIMTYLYHHPLTGGDNCAVQE